MPSVLNQAEALFLDPACVYTDDDSDEDEEKGDVNVSYLKYDGVVNKDGTEEEKSSIHYLLEP
eukprot:2771841-Ditylum_brightwellii.AAC.1